MAEKIYGADTITIAVESFLLVGGDASHLAAEAQEKDGGRPAIEPWIY